MAELLFATLHTNRGDIRLELYPNQAPKTVANFVELAEGSREWTDPRTGRATDARLYDGTTFHRVIPDFMIQGGDPLGTGTGGPGYRFADETHPELTFSEPYLLAMANAGPNTERVAVLHHRGADAVAELQAHHLRRWSPDADGRDVVDAIATTPTGAQDRPSDPVVIESVAIERVVGSNRTAQPTGRRDLPSATGTPTARRTSPAAGAAARSARTA